MENLHNCEEKNYTHTEKSSSNNYFLKGNNHVSSSLSQTSKCSLMSYIILSVSLNFSIYFCNINFKISSFTLSANVPCFQVS